MGLCSVCKRNTSLYFYKNKYYCGKCIKIAGHEDEYQKIKPQMQKWQLEDLTYLIQKKVEDNLLIHPKNKNYAGEWKLLYSLWKSRTETLRLFIDMEQKYHLISYGGVHKTIFEFENKRELANFLRKLIEASGFKPETNSKRKNGRARYYI